MRTLLAALVGLAAAAAAPAQEVLVFAGSAAKPALEEAARAFEARTGTAVRFVFGGSGTVLAQMELARRGDLYVPGSPDFMEKAKRRGLVDPATEARLAYLVPAIAVPRGNPAGVRSLADLARPGVRVGIARPDTVCVGLYAVEVLERAGLAGRVRPNIVNYAESCAKTAQMAALGLVDAVMGWDVFDDWNPGRIETVPLPPDAVVRIAYIPAAVSAFCRTRPPAVAFLRFLTGPEGRAVFGRHGYLTSLEAARRLARPDTPAGGEFRLPPGWRGLFRGKP